MRNLAIASLVLLVGCDGSGGEKSKDTNVFGFVFGTNEQGLENVPVMGSRTNSSGRFGSGANGPFILVGGSPEFASIVIPLDTSTAGRNLVRPVYLPPIESGIQAAVQSGSSNAQILEDPIVPGVVLTIPPFVQVNTGFIRILPIAPDMMPVALPSNRATRAAYLVDPHDLVIDPPADFRVPNLDSLPAGQSAEFYWLDPATGKFAQIGTLFVDAGGATLTGVGVVDQGGLYAVAPSAVPAVTAVRGRVISPSATPVEDYAVLLPGSITVTSDFDGRFDVGGVPVHDGQVIVRVLSAPGFGDEYLVFGPFAPVIGGTTDIGNLSVLAAPRDNISPTVTFDPVDGATGVREDKAITVTFNETIDISSFAMELFSNQGSVPGATSFSADGRKVTFQPIDLLEQFETYSILLDFGTTDLASNPIDAEDALATFETRQTAGTPTTAIELFGVSRLTARAGEPVTLVGQNFTGANFVTVGGTTTTTVTQTQTTIVAVVPLSLDSGTHPVRVDGIGDLDLTILPTLLSLDPAIGTQSGGDTITLVGRSFGTTPSVLINGLSASLVDSVGDTARIVVAAETRSGPVVVETSGNRSESRFFFSRGP